MLILITKPILSHKLLIFIFLGVILSTNLFASTPCSNPPVDQANLEQIKEGTCSQKGTSIGNSFSDVYGLFGLLTHLKDVIRNADQSLKACNDSASDSSTECPGCRKVPRCEAHFSVSPNELSPEVKCPREQTYDIADLTYTNSLDIKGWIQTNIDRHESSCPENCSFHVLVTSHKEDDHFRAKLDLKCTTRSASRYRKVSYEIVNNWSCEVQQ